MSPSNRRYDIDWIRVIAIGLLLVYHVAIELQPWGIMIGFIANEKSWASLWLPMSMLNVWRIPLLFFVSGMGVYFAIQSRTWKQLLLERAGRIFVPFVFGIFCIVPIQHYIWRYHYNMELKYLPGPDHLWFLGNIFVYVVVFAPFFFYLKGNDKIVKTIKRIFSTPLGLLPVIACFIGEVLLVKPYPYEMYALTWHGFFLGMVAFFFGFCFMLGAESFRGMIIKWRWLFISAAVIFFVIRLTQFQTTAPAYLISIESNLWIFSVLAFGTLYLNRPGKVLRYLSQAAYPIYILHIIFMFLGSMLIFPLEIEPPIQYFLVLIFTLAGCFITYEIIRRIKFMRPLIGLKMEEKRAPGSVPVAG
jgi:glucan biosynthesis protein C